MSSFYTWEAESRAAQGGHLICPSSHKTEEESWELTPEMPLCLPRQRAALVFVDLEHSEAFHGGWLRRLGRSRER